MIDDPADSDLPLPTDTGAHRNTPRAYGETDLSYGEYLNIDALLSLQEQQSRPPHHDEMLFIIIHQAYELWFKLILYEVDQTLAYMAAGQVLRARHFLNRVVEILRLLVPQIHILETMEPVEFLQFRNRLMPASGFQSVQFREIEFAAGLKDARYLRFFKSSPDLVERLQNRLDGPDLRTEFYDLLRSLGFDVPNDVSLAHLASNDADRERVIEQVVEIYKKDHGNLPLYLLTESLVDFDQQLALWREHHVRVVGRIIGHKTGTGGSSGVAYLKRTTEKRCFPFLWESRTYLERV